jgi:hypothetical protein
LCAEFTDISRLVSPDSLPGFSAGYCQRAVVDESENCFILFAVNESFSLSRRSVEDFRFSLWRL